MKKVVLVLSLIFGLGCVYSLAHAVKFTSPPASKEYWKVFCNKPGRNVVLGIYAPNNNHVQMAGPFYDEPAARNWANQNCNSWRCDWNGRCVKGNTRTTPNPSTQCPPGTYRDSGVFGQGSGKCIPIK